MTRPRRVVVVGGGLAGIAAALRLARAGRRVVLCERRPFLGGRVFSFADPESGAVVDNGQHVLVGACTRLRALLDSVGAPRAAFTRQRRLSVPVLDAGGRRAHLSAAPLPPPFHVVPSLLRYRHLAPSERRATARALAALVRAKGAELDATPLGAWLTARGIGDRAVERFWDPFVRPALNTPARDANVPLAAFFFRTTVWGGARGGALWLPAVGLSDAVGHPAALALARAGVELRLDARVARVLDAGPSAGRAEGVELAGGDVLEADDVVAAVPRNALRDLAGEAALPAAALRELAASPIVNVYLWYDRPVCDAPFAGTLDPDLQWVFDRERLLGADAAGGHCVGASLSAADAAVGDPKTALAERADQAVARLFPARRGATLLRHAVVKEPRATFRAEAGLAGRRPAPGAAPLAGLWIAGDWTDTGWPATMEGAVRSGEAAADALLAKT